MVDQLWMWILDESEPLLPRQEAGTSRLMNKQTPSLLHSHTDGATMNPILRQSTRQSETT